MNYTALGIDKQVVTLVTQVEVDPDDTAFSHPSKTYWSLL